MSSLIEVEQQIAFALHRLSAQNRHHEFEHLCRRLARKRICSNIVPATGPVSAGGDQGRDFETFRTYLHELPETSAFGALASGRPIVFACSLQQENIPGKIKDDIASILVGASVDEIHFFTSGSVPTAKRHELQAWATEQHELHLDIYDREAITELLSDPDVFWIATEFLSVPPEIYPRDVDDGRYAKLKATWTPPESRALNYAGFAQLKRVARDLLRDESLRPDVEFWLDRFGEFREHELADLAHMAVYETAVLKLRIKGDMHGQEDEIRRFVKYALDSVDVDRLTELACLVSYCTGAIFDSAVSFTPEEVRDFRDQLVARVNELLDRAVDPSIKCSLLVLRGHITVIPDAVLKEFPAINSAIDDWMRMVTLIPDAPLFDLTEFSDRLTSIVEILVDADRYDELVQIVDALLANRAGRYAAAEARVNRAQKLIAAGRLLLGVRELNKAKRDWFSKETIEISAAALIDLSGYYSQLGLVYAAKYYALAAAWIVLQAGDDNAKRLVRPALVRAGECDYEAGAWLEALDFFSVAQRAEAAFSAEPMGDDEPDLQRLLMYGAYILGVSRAQPKSVQDAVRDKLKFWPDLDAVEHGADQAQEAFYEIARSEGGDTELHLSMPPFVDAAPIRRFEWSALGIRWDVSWPNSLELTLMVEQFIAVLQLLTADLASSDLYILPGRVAVQVRVDRSAKQRRLRRLPSNDASVWEMVVPGDEHDEGREKHHRLDIAQSIMLVHEVSLRPEKWPVVERFAAEGPFANTMVGEEYVTLCRRLCGIDVRVLDSDHRDPNLREIRLRRAAHPELAWNTELADEYDADDAQVFLRNRYERFAALTRRTLPRLLSNEECSANLRVLRAEGWLDWQILGAISGIAMNYRLSKFDSGRGSREELQKFCDRYMASTEAESWLEVPLDAFTVASLRFQMTVNAASTLKGVGLVCRQQTPNTTALLEFLRHKMRYFDDDIPHDDILGA